MASKPIDPRPVALPNLSQLPDPTKDLFGGMTSPTALMSMGEKEVNDLFSVKPLTDMYIKPSAEASKALQIAQQTQEAINRQAEQAQEALARQEREIAEQRQRSIEEQIKLARKDAEERAKALEEKAKKQGGKVGAAPDGSFVLTADINKILGSQEWNSVVSDKQRGDQAEAYLSQYATQLKEMGVTDGQIAAEIENGRGIFKAHTDAYAKSMRSDGQGLLDLTVAPAAKAGAFIFNTAGVLSKLVSADTVGDFLLERGKTATDAANDFESASIKLDRANSAYDEQKFNKANPNTNWRDGGITGTAHGMGAAVKRAWDNDTLDNFVAEQIPQLIMTLGAGKVGATGVSAAGRAMGYTNLAANNVPTALRVLGGTYKTKSGVTQLGVNALSGASLGVGAYGTAASVGDAGAGAWEQVKSTSFDDIKKTYGEKKWADAVALHGGEEQARDALAGEALERAAGKVAPVGAVTSFLGVESTFAALLTRQAVKEEAKKLTLKGLVKGTGTTALSAAEEGVEEGYTQYASNVGATEFTGVDLMEGVSSAAGLGAFMGGATTATINIMSDAKKENDTLPNDFARAFVEQGNFDDKAFRQNFERKMDWLSRGHKEGKVSTNDTQHFQQTYFNDYIDTAYTVTREDGSTDTKSIWDLMTPEQAQNFRDYVRLNYGINTNNYARHQDTVEYDTIKNNNMEVLSRPENADLLNVWRILNNTDTDQIPADKRDYYMALADTTIQLRPTETTHNTHEREQVFAQFRDTDLKNRGFDEMQLTGITEFARTILGANSRRFTDEEQQAWNKLQQEQSNGTNEQNQTGNSQSDGQGPIDGNAEPVATQGGGTGTSQATTLRQAAEELADAFSGRPASPDAQSVGNGNPRQGVDTSSQTNTPTENGAGVAQPNAGAGQVQTAGDTVNSAATEIRSGASAQAGNTEQVNQGGQPTRPTVAPATQATTGGGSVGTPPTKRNTDGGGKQTPTQAANSLAKTGADIPIEFVQQFINNNKPKKLTLAKVKGYVADKLGVPVTKTSPTQAQVLQYLAKIPNAQFIADLSAVFTNKGGKIVKDSQNTINDLHSARHELYKAWAKSQPKTNPEQATTDTNADNGSQDVGETNVADIADENPQVAVEQPVQTADDVETVEQAEELVEDVIDFLLDTYPDLDVNEVLSSIYEHYDALNDYFINIPNANDQLADLFLMTSKIIEDKARYNRYTNALQNASVAAELVGDDFNMVFDNTIASADPAVTNNIEKRISRLEQYIELALDDAQNQQEENDRIRAIREFNAEVERHNRELDEAIRNTGIEVPQFILQTSPADISNAIAELVTPLSKRGKSKRAKLASKKIKLPKSDKGNKQNLNQLVGDTRESVIITGAYDAPKTGHLVGTDTGVLFVPDDGTTAFELPTRPFQQDTINSWNKKNADTGISLDYTYHSFYDNEFYTRGDDFELNEVTAKQETANERAAQKALYDRQRQSRTDETSTSEQIASDNRREKVISQDENGRWRMQVANNRLPALRTNTTPAVVETSRVSDRTIRLGTDVATDTGLGVIALDYKSDVQVSDAIQQLADATGLDFAQLTKLFVQELQNPVTFPYTQAQIDNLIARLDDEAENRAIPQTRVRRTPTVTETANANEQNQTETEPRESSPAIDTTATQDTAGASGLAGDTQTTASQAEPVKPKRGGRSKKKTTAQLDLFEQEQTNDTQNNLGQSVQPTRERTQDENQTDIVGNDNTTNDEQGEILGQSGQPISKQSQESGTETTQDAKQLGVETAGDEALADQPQPQAQTPTASEGNKAVDTNGKPVVVYRGASHGLGVMSFRGAMFFTDNKRVAESYVRGGKLHTATLYMANPAITDANGGEWGNVVPNGSKTQYVVDVLENDTLREENPELFELINNTIYESYEEAEKAAEEWERQGVQNFGVAMQGGLNSTAVSTDAFVRQAKAAGHDGVIIRNIIDGARTPSDIYVVFDTNQTTPIEDSPPTAPTDSQVRQTVSEQSQESGTETTQDTEQLGVETPKPKKKHTSKKDNAVAQEINEAVEKERLQKEFDLINDYHYSLPLSKQEDTVEDFIAKVGYALALEQSTTWQQAEADAQAKLKAEREARWAKLREREAQGIYEDDFDISENSSAIQSDIDAFTSERGILSGDRMGSQTGAVELEFLLALPIAVYRAAKAIWNAIKKNVAAVSMALAITTGTTLAIPTEANAATPTETAVVQNIVGQNDNQGKQFIVADKQAGTLTMYTASGQQITSTPALFGKTAGDSVSSKNTPSGRFETKQANVSTEGYGGSAQVLTQNGQNLQLGGSSYAIHRVYTKYASENRQGRLDTPTATDNRISLGCINVPVDFYDTYLNSDQATVVYVMPETDAGRTGVFNVVPTATQTATDTKEQVEPAYDNANAQSVEVTPEQLTNATPHDQVKVAPKLVPTPLIVKGAEQSTQVAYTTPTVLGGANGTAPITADRIVTPKIDGKVVHTPAEQRADTSFDTEPVKDKTDDGVSLAEVAVGLAAAFAGGMYVNRRKERTKAKKLESKKRTPVADNPPPTDSTPTPDPTPNMPQDPPTTEQVQDTVNAEHNEQVNKSANNAKTIPTDIKIPPQPTATALAVNREMWLKYLVETNQLGETGSQEMADLLLNTLRGFEYSNLAIMTDKSYQQANDGTFGNHRWWGDGEVNTDRTGIFNKFINIAAGATPIFDNLMGKLGIARGGHEADSSLASIALAQVKSKAQGAYAQIHKFFVKPMVERTKLLAQELRRGDDEVELATGRVATANHILNEAADAMWRGFDAELAHLQDSLDKVNADLAANPSNKDYPLRTMNTAKKLEDEIRQVSELYTRTRNMYEGKTAWDGETKLPGGMTKARAEQDIAEVKAEYGADYAKIEENAKELTKSIRGIRQFATAAGVFTNSDIEVFNELGFDEYVPLYSEERDPTDVNEEDNYTQSSTMDRITQGIPLTQARSMGLTKDLSRYRRKGAKSPAADGFTNMKKFAMNMAGRVGQQNWVEMTQQLYEGTVGKPYSAANITDPDTLADLNASYDSGKVPGLIRVRPGMKNFLPSDIQTKIDKVRPIMGKGKNANGDTVAFEYYWTEPAIQVEIYANTDLSDTLTTDHLRNIGTATRAAARLVTVGKPMWNVYNFVRDSFERVSVMLMRPAKDQSGNLVPKWKLATAFFRVLPTIVLNAKDIYRYLVLGEVKTPLQTMLNEAVGEGAINLMTTQTEKHSVIGDLKKSELEKAGNKISKWLGDTANKTGAGGVRNASTKGLDFYIVAMTEIPQVSTALASYMAYQNVGVNKKESANRVRDAYDPNRTNNKLIHNVGQFHPFVRSTFSGHYNLARSLTQYWKPGEWQFTLAYTLGGTLGVIGLLSMLAGAFDDDDDGRSALARLPLSVLMGGIPVPWGENGVWTLPVGFGMNKFIWSIGANFYRYINGYQSADETAMGLAGLLVDNTSPLQAASGSSLAENPTAAAVMTAMPMLLKPIVEMGFNTKAYGGGKIWGKDTPQDQLDSQQDNFNTPETYKKWAGWLTENGFGDFRPETLRHLFESYGNLAGPLSAIPQSVIADQSEKTLGNKERKGEVFGATLTALGAGMSIQPNALDVANLTYEMDARRYELHRKYGVGETHTDEIYEQYAQRGERGGIQEDAKYVTEVRLREKGVPEEHIKYIVNGMAYQKKREELDKEFKDLALEYNRLVASGKEDLQMRQSVQNAWDALETLTNDYVKENNNVFFTLQ